MEPEPTTTATPPETTSSPAPAATPPASPAPSTVQRPLTALQAFEQVAAAQEPPIAATSASAATAQPAIDVPAGAPAAVEPGPIPFREHKTILENTRTKAFTERDAQWNQSYGWARGISPEHGPKVAEFYRAMEADPVAYYQRLGEALASNPSFAARFQQLSGNGHAKPQQANLSDPDLVVDDGNGRQIATYSADRVKGIVADEVRKAVQEVRHELAPLRDAHQQSLVDQQSRVVQQQLHQQADTMMTRATKILGATIDAKGQPDARSQALWAKVSALMDADPQLEVVDAALQVREQIVAPQETESAKTAAAEEMRRKANANTANGAGSGSSPITRPRTEKELAKFLEQRAGASA